MSREEEKKEPPIQIPLLVYSSITILLSEHH